MGRGLGSTIFERQPLERCHQSLIVDTVFHGNGGYPESATGQGKDIAFVLKEDERLASRGSTDPQLGSQLFLVEVLFR